MSTLNTDYRLTYFYVHTNKLTNCCLHRFVHMSFKYYDKCSFLMCHGVSLVKSWRQFSDA